MCTPTDSEETETQEADDAKEGKAYDDLVEGLFFQQPDEEK